MKRYLALALWGALIAGTAEAAKVGKVERPTPTWGHRLLYYLPNRVLDVVDLFRFRLKVGPGAAVSARATEVVSVYAGSYQAFYVGLPGPRHPYQWRLPVGREQYKGISVGTVDATDENPYEPDYTRSEFDLGLYALIAGAEVGTDPVEWWDLVAGLVMADPRRDDL